MPAGSFCSVCSWKLQPQVGSSESGTTVFASGAGIKRRSCNNTLKHSEGRREKLKIRELKVWCQFIVKLQNRSALCYHIVKYSAFFDDVSIKTDIWMWYRCFRLFFGDTEQKNKYKPQKKKKKPAWAELEQQDQNETPGKETRTSEHENTQEQ